MIQLPPGSIAAGWTLDTSGLAGTVTVAGDTITISGINATTYIDSFRIAPPTDSDVDLGAIMVSATAVDPSDPALTATRTDTLDVHVDAIADPVTVAIDVRDSGDRGASFRACETGSVTVTATFGDTPDGSEIQTLVVDVPAGFVPSHILDGGVYDAAAGTISWSAPTGLGTFATTFDVTNTLSVEAVATFKATATASEDPPSDHECDLADNVATAVATDVVDLVETWRPHGGPHAGEDCDGDDDHHEDHDEPEGYCGHDASGDGGDRAHDGACGAAGRLAPLLELLTDSGLHDEDALDVTALIEAAIAAHHDDTGCEDACGAGDHNPDPTGDSGDCEAAAMPMGAGFCGPAYCGPAMIECDGGAEHAVH